MDDPIDDYADEFEYQDYDPYEPEYEHESEPIIEDCLTCAFWLDKIDGCELGDLGCSKAIMQNGCGYYEE